MISLSTRRQGYFRWFAGLGLVLIALVFLVISTRVSAASPEAVSRSGRHVLTIHDGTQEKGVFTEADTLGDALKEAGIVLDDNDVTEPSRDEKLVAPTYEVNIYRARPVVIVDGAKRTKVLTPYQTAKQVAQQAGLELHDEDEARFGASDNIMRDGALETLTITRATPFTFVFYGKTLPSYTMATTVGEMLKAKNVELKENDRLSVDLSAPITAGMKVELWREGKQVVTREESVAYSVRRVEDANQKVGYRKVQTPGTKGKKMVTYEVVIKNGKEVSKKAIKTIVTEKAKEQVEIVGTRPSFSGDFAAALAKLRSCEGGYNSWNPAGPYYGAYQFDRGTWNSVSSAPYGSATPAEQDAAARALYERRGWQPWPHCGASLPDTHR